MGQIGSVTSGLVLNAGAEDDEHPYYAPRSPCLQRRLQAVLDEFALSQLEALSCSDDRPSLARPGDLKHECTSHSSLWSLSAVQGPTIEESSELVEAV